MHVRLCGKRWKLRFTALQNNRGECDGPTIAGKEIRIDRRLKGMERLEILIHECLHAIDWRADEEHVAQSAADLARTLWRLGYRGTDDADAKGTD